MRLLGALLLAAFSTAVAAQASVTFAWDAVSDSRLLGYRLLFGTSSGTYSSGSVDAGLNTTATVTGLADATTYFFVAQSYGADGLVSDYSAEVAYTTSAPPPPVDSTPPSIISMVPANGAMLRGNGTVTISASAADNVAVTQIQLTIDNVVVASGNSASIAYNWSLKRVASGTHTIVATAKDAAGNVGSKTSVVTRK